MFDRIKNIGNHFLGLVLGAVVGLVAGAFTGAWYHCRLDYGPFLLVTTLWGLVSGGIRFLFKGMIKGGSEGVEAGALYYQNVYRFYYPIVKNIQDHYDHVKNEPYPVEKDFVALLTPIELHRFKQKYIYSIKEVGKHEEWLERVEQYRLYATSGIRNNLDPITIVDAVDKRVRVHSRTEYLQGLQREINEEFPSLEPFLAPSFTLGFPQQVLDFIREVKQWLTTHDAKKQPIEGQVTLPMVKKIHPEYGQRERKANKPKPKPKPSENPAMLAWAASSGQGPAWDGSSLGSGFGLFQESPLDSKEEAWGLQSGPSSCWSGTPLERTQWVDNPSSETNNTVLQRSSRNGCWG